MKQCSKCKQLKPESEFGKDRSRADGLQPRCKECKKQLGKQWREANPEYNKQHYAENHERELERRKQYYATNRKKISKQRKRRKTENPEQYLWEAAKRRAKKRGLEFNIEVSDIVIPEVCQVLGLKLEQGNGKSTASSPSLDRIDSSKGYVKGNVRVISHRANLLKNNATVEELKLLLVDADFLERNAA
jgi:hypothetical protein